jgi:quercetin dioxygenase-like cupin family protein
MAETAKDTPQTVPHHGLHKTTVGVVGTGAGSKVFHLDEIAELSSEHDGRRKKLLLNNVNTGAALLVDVVSYAPGGTSPLHFHRAIDHFFFVLEGRGRIVINEKEHRLRAGSVVWIASEDVHKVYADPDSPLTFLEYFSRGEHETVFLEQACEWRPQPGR